MIIFQTRDIKSVFVKLIVHKIKFNYDVLQKVIRMLQFAKTEKKTYFIRTNLKICISSHFSPSIYVYKLFLWCKETDMRH